MKKLIVVLCALCVTGTLWAQRRKTVTAQQSAARRAFEKRETGGVSPRPAWLDEGNPTALREQRSRAALRERQWRAWLTQIPYLVETKNVVSIQIAKIENTNQRIVTLIDIDGNRTSFSCADDSSDRNLVVREITRH